MDKPAWEVIETVFHEATALPPDERQNFVDSRCAGDDALRDEVLSLLRSFEAESQFLESSPISEGNAVLRSSGPDLSGRVIGSYEIIRKIGSGGMGDVYLAEDRRLSRSVAVKFLKKNLLDEGSAKRRFIREAKAVAMLDHPNICGIYGIEEVGEHDFIVMQFVDGRTISEYLAEENPSAEQILALAGQIAEALAVAHEHGIIHRDIKPGNILVNADGQAKILDFGLAKIVQDKRFRSAEEPGTSQISQSGLILGTVSYMSPEQLRGESLDFSSDIFSFGIVLREMLTGIHPFARRSQAETIAAIIGNDLRSEGESKRKIPPAVGNILDRCLSNQSSARFSNGRELAGALAEKEILQPPLSSRISGLYRYSAVVFVMLLIAVTVAFFVMRDAKPIVLAILPIQNRSQAADAPAVSFGLTGNLISKFSRAGKIRVLPHTLVAGFENRSALEAAPELGADMILAGRLVDRDGRVVLEMTLTRASDGREVAADQIEVNGEKLLEAQKRIAERIIEKIAPTMSGIELETIFSPPTDNADALWLYYRGRREWNRLQGGNVEQAIRSFEAAVALDQEFALAYAGLADAYSFSSIPSNSNPIKPKDAYAKARFYAERANEIDPNLSESWTSLAMIELSYGWDWKKAEENFQRAVALDPSNATARFGYSRLLTVRGRFDDARTEAGKALELNPADLSTQINVAVISVYTRNYAAAEEQYRKMIDSGNNTPRVRYGLGLTYLRSNRIAEAIGLFEEIAASNRALSIGVLGYGYARSGREADARAVLLELETAPPGTYVSTQEKALTYVGLREFENAFKNLMSACEERFPALPGLLHDALLDELRPDPRFEELRRCVDANSIQ